MEIFAHISIPLWLYGVSTVLPELEKAPGEGDERDGGHGKVGS